MILARIFAALGWCTHPDGVYRERRELHGAGVLVIHWVCGRCGWAEPAMHRTPDEHVEIASGGRLLPFVSRREQ